MRIPGYHRRILRRAIRLLLPLLALLVAGSATARPPDGAPAPRVEVIVQLAGPPAGRTTAGDAPAVLGVRLAQRRFEASLARVVPGARVQWRYSHVLDGLAVALPAGSIGTLRALPGVVRVYPSLTYRAVAAGPAVTRRLRAVAQTIGDGGRGVRIGIIDDGIDPDHVYFDPAGFAAPAGFPKGDLAFTSAKIIVARAFPPPGVTWRYADRPFDPVNSYHGTHVAGIAAGDAGTPVPGSLDTASGVAPLAYLGNYKALTVPTASGLGLNGNSPELVAAIDAAVADGMDVINLSLGEPEIDPARDAVATALDGAAAAGVIPVVAAGNDFDVLGPGSVTSPGSAADAITVGATSGHDAHVIASFSGGGPTPLGLLPKPDVSAPGVSVLSSLPGDEFGELSGTSMATPYVAGVAALLRNAHPDWTVAQLKSAIVLTATPVWRDHRATVETPSTRQGGGEIDPAAAADPRIFASPQGLGFGLIDVSGGRAVTVTRTLEVTDAGDGAGPWAVEIDPQENARGVTFGLPGRIDVPGALTVTVRASARAAELEHTGWIVLRRDGRVRRVPFWLRVTRPRLGREHARPLVRTGTYRDSTRDRPSLVSTYRYPAAPPSTVVRLRGPERVFRVNLAFPVANLGAAIISSGRHVSVEPRIVIGADENRLVGATGLSVVTNPYLTRFGQRVATSAALMPAPGTYSIVVDSLSRASAGSFSVRVWIDDTTPPTVSLRSHVARNGRLLARVSDAGAGVDPDGIVFTIDGGFERPARLVGDTAVLSLHGVKPGRHSLVLRVSDRQEAKNNENVPLILPNTRTVHTTIRVPTGKERSDAAAAP